MQIILRGGASQTKKVLIVEKDQLGLTLLNFLQLKKIPIASSCRGVGSCTLCCFNGVKLSCQVKVQDHLDEEVLIDYL